MTLCVENRTLYRYCNKNWYARRCPRVAQAEFVLQNLRDANYIAYRILAFSTDFAYWTCSVNALPL